MVKEITGGYKILCHSNGRDQPPIEIDFTPPFRYVKFDIVFNGLMCWFPVIAHLLRFRTLKHYLWPYRRIPMIEGLEETSNGKIKLPNDLESEETNKYLQDACERFDVKCPPPHTTSRLLDKVGLSLLPFHCVASQHRPSMHVEVNQKMEYIPQGFLLHP